ncbi:hypothetical protein DENSPDRAFT_933292, partial [Dentipellis sp. KUC8613]
MGCGECGTGRRGRVAEACACAPRAIYPRKLRLPPLPMPEVGAPALAHERGRRKPTFRGQLRVGVGYCHVLGGTAAVNVEAETHTPVKTIREASPYPRGFICRICRGICSDGKGMIQTVIHV